MPDNFVLGLLVFLAVLTVLVFVHELGHYLTAVFFKVHVEEFAIGFPPRLLGVVQDKDNRWRLFWWNNVPSPEELGGKRTIYSLNILPIGGFVRPEGEDDPSKPKGLAAASKTARFVVLAAGSTFNLIFAFLVFVIGFQIGMPDRVAIADVVADTPAQQVGLLKDDTILTINGETMYRSQQVSEMVLNHLGQPLTVVVERQGQAQTLNVTPRVTWPQGQGPLGIVMTMAPSLVRYSFPDAVVRSATELQYYIVETVRLPARLISGQINWQTNRPVGIVGMNDITRLTVQTAIEQDRPAYILSLIGMISAALALTNLLPLPALDGGRIVFVLLEAVRGKRIDPAREGMVHFVGLVMLLALMLVITYQDIFNPIIPR